MSDAGLSAPTFIPQGPQGGMAAYGSDRSLHVKFYAKRVYMEAESLKQGKPVYEMHDYVHISQPGAKTDIERRVRETMPEGCGIPSDPERFPRHWDAYKSQREQAQDGTPIEEFAPMPQAIREDFKACKIHTVEQLSALHDGNASQMPLEWRRWRDKAQVWLKAAQDSAPIMALQAENDTLKTDLAMLKEQMAQLSADNASKKGKS